MSAFWNGEIGLGDRHGRKAERVLMAALIGNVALDGVIASTAKSVAARSGPRCTAGAGRVGLTMRRAGSGDGLNDVDLWERLLRL
jgi:hypothetical protein